MSQKSRALTVVRAAIRMKFFSAQAEAARKAAAEAGLEENLLPHEEASYEKANGTESPFFEPTCHITPPVGYSIAVSPAGMSPQGMSPRVSVHNLEPPGPPKQTTGFHQDLLAFRELVTASWLNLLLVCVPLGLMSQYMQWSPVATFSLNFLALIPLALMLGNVTEDLALRFGDTVGGLINATFGNTVEIIISISALQKGLYTVVAMSLLGSVLSNLLLVLGCCMLFGGFYYKTQTFNEVGNRACSALLFLSAIGIILPTAAAHLIVFPGDEVHSLAAHDHFILYTSRAAAIILLLCYFCYLTFQLHTHAEMFKSEGEAAEPIMSIIGAFTMLTLITAIVAFASQALTGTIEEVSVSTGVGQEFLGLIILPIAGNACEHITAVVVAMKNKMDLALGVAVGSSIQISLFALPVCVLVGWATGHDFTLAFDSFSALALTLAVIHANFITSDATSHWLMGVQLLAVYLLIAVTFYFR